jgi:hypothetical protein
VKAAATYSLEKLKDRGKLTLFETREYDFARPEAAHKKSSRMHTDSKTREELFVEGTAGGFLTQTTQSQGEICIFQDFSLFLGFSGFFGSEKRRTKRRGREMPNPLAVRDVAGGGIAFGAFLLGKGEREIL